LCRINRRAVIGTAIPAVRWKEKVMESVKNILFWCMIMGFAVLLIWFGMIAFAGEAIYSFHTELGTMRMLSLELFMSANYIGIGMWKMCVIFWFAIPWLAMSLVDRHRH
jgi:hypothetical protein